MNRVRSFLQANAIVILAALLAIAVAVAAWQSVRVQGFSFGPFKVEGLQAKATRLEGEAKQARADADLSEALRAQEQAQDRDSYTDLSTRCEQRVQAARDAAQAIEEITNANVANDRPVPAADRGIIPAGQLRRVIGQPQGGPTRLPTGSDRSPQP